MTIFPFKRYARLLLINFVLLFVLVYFISFSINKKIEKNIEDIQIETINQLRFQDYDNLQDYDVEDLKQITKNFEQSSFEFANDNRIELFFVIASSYLFIQLLNMIFIAISNKKYILSIDKFTNSIINKQFDVSLKENDESVISNINNRFNKLGMVIKKNYGKMNQEKIKFKSALEDIAHQIKTPLSALKMYNEIILDSENLNKEQVEFLNLSDIQISRLDWLISSLLKISKFEADIIELNTTKFVISELGQSIKETLINNLKNRKLTIKEIGDMSKEVNLDFKWTREALLNLVKNATEHAKKNSEIIINYTVNISIIRIDILNKGNLISSKDMSKIFTRFYKSSENSNPDSVGIGLNLSKKIIEKQGGTIAVQNLNDGVMFSIIFLKF